MRGKQIVMFRLRIESFLLAVGFAINWILTFARDCGSDKFLDPFTGNCDPCGPVCAIGNCSSVCPNYVMPPSPSNTTTTVSSSDNSLNTSQLFSIISPPILFGLVLVIIVITIYRRFCREEKACCYRTVYRNPVQEIGKDRNREEMALNRDIEDV
ncbi:hypothetical protein CHS0354_020337 [Potamilus streckersoni]|uniref:Uncharacterized protein n=1 Tax=Potamilus streckersoni TaxID=2493646 RepID=A0AAE0VUC0_9BIVA|nr:hypothetical protein CHS0354_020337 [Potamilus streckersoni]